MERGEGREKAPSSRELELLVQCVAEGHTSGGGPYGKACERLIGELVGGPYVLLTASAGQAFEMSVMLANGRGGDEVILSTLSNPRVANAFLLQGVRLVFSDVRTDTLAIDPNGVEGLTGHRTKVVVFQHGAGSSSDLEAIARLTRRQGAFLVEDACDFFGAVLQGVPVGSSGDFAVYSFDASQNISCGEAGALVLRDRKHYERGEILREKGTNRSQFFRGEIDKYTWVDLGSSYVLADLLAAFLSVQLERREELAECKARLRRRYESGLEDLCEDGLLSLPTYSSGCLPGSRGFLVFTRESATRLELGEWLRRRGISVGLGPRALHTSAMGKRLGYRQGMFPAAESLSGRGIALPLGPELPEDEVRRVIGAVRCFFRR